MGLVCVVALLIAPVSITMLINNIALDLFARQLDGVTATDGVELLERKAALGKLSGNGNGLDFLACRLIRADMTLDELGASLILPEFHAAQWGLSNGVGAKLLAADSAWSEREPFDRTSIAFESLAWEQDLSAYHLLVIYDAGYSAWLEPRGH